MATLAVPDSTSTHAFTPVSPRPAGRPSGYSDETAGRLCEAIRRRGWSDTKAARTLGIAPATLTDWKKAHPDLDDWLAMAREQFREAKLTIVDEARTPDGRPNWRAAVWALERAFPEDYGRAPRPRREEQRAEPDWRQSAAVLERAFPEEYGDTAQTGQPGAGLGWPQPQGVAEVPAPAREMIAVLLEENEEMRPTQRAAFGKGGLNVHGTRNRDFTEARTGSGDALGLCGPR